MEGTRNWITGSDRNTFPTAKQAIIRKKQSLD